MKVFNAYFKIFKKSSLPTTLMNVMLFLVITILFVSQTDTPTEKAFNIEKCKVAIIDNDNSAVSKGLQQFLYKNTKIITLSEKDKNNLNDVLFFRIAECIYTVPNGFQDSLKEMEKNKYNGIETLTIPDSSVSAMVNQMVNKYLNTVSMYMASSNLDITTAVNNALRDLEVEIKVNLTQKQYAQNSTEKLLNFFNCLVYPLSAIMILAVALPMIKLNKADLKRRNICSPMHMTKYNMELFMANILISIIIYLTFMCLAAVIYKGTLFTSHGMLLLLNSFVFTICCLSLSFLIANIANEKSISAISTTFSLLLSFIGGAFVPQSMLSSTVKNIGNFVPSFWYVKGNNLLNDVSTLNFESLKPYMTSLLVQTCFAVVFLAIALVIIKQKRTSEQ